MTAEALLTVMVQPLTTHSRHGGPAAVNSCYSTLPGTQRIPNQLNSPKQLQRVWCVCNTQRCCTAACSTKPVYSAHNIIAAEPESTALLPVDVLSMPLAQSPVATEGDADSIPAHGTQFMGKPLCTYTDDRGRFQPPDSITAIAQAQQHMMYRDKRPHLQHSS